MTDEPDASPQEVDFQQFDSVEDALARIDPGDQYLELARLLTTRGDESMGMTIEIMFWSSVLTRCYGLHAAIAREIGHQNPHAVLPLLRSFAETMALLMYVDDHPKYIDALLDRPRKGRPKRQSPQALLSYASTRAPGMKGIYEDLSEATHFGSVAM
jgi:hypothetical protein